MLIQYSLPECVQAALFTHFSLEIAEQAIICDWFQTSQYWKMCSQHDQHRIDRCGKSVLVESKADDGLSPCSLAPPSVSQLSAFRTISGSSNLAVYYRKKFQRNTPPSCPPQSSAKVGCAGGCDSAMCSEALSGGGKEQRIFELEVETDATRSSNRSPVERNAEPLFSKSESCNGCPDGDYRCSEEASRSDTLRLLNPCLNENCSSSKSNLDLGSASLKNDVDDTSECSSSGALVPEGLHDNMPERDICISVLRKYGLLENICTTQAFTSTRNCCQIACKVCGCTDTTLKMLICDNCNDIFHLSCCNPHVKKVPYDEWFCLSCLRKKRKLLKENSSSKSLHSMEAGGCSNILSKGESGLIASMLRSTEPYNTSVRIGNQFQADVPDWNGPVNNEASPITEPVEMDPSESLHDSSTNKPFKISSIGNWLQCQQVIEGIGEDVDGTICGKWRRAPLFEVQTDDWECFQSVLWDPAHADCAVPQELETAEVLKQLKYIEMLKPKLDVKRRKLDCTKRSDLQNDSET
nr:histone-lysine N-methyltransferase 2C isoform X3 [Ipomoea batatas]